MSTDPENFMLADDLMKSIMSALAVGHAQLVTDSRTRLGTLAVKSATLNVSFDFSVVGKDTDRGIGLTVRPAPLFGLTPTVQTADKETQTQITNRAAITIEIVNVAEPDTQDQSGAAGGSQVQGGDQPPPTVDEIVKRVRAALQTMHAFLQSLGVRDGPVLSSVNDTLDLLSDPTKLDEAKSLRAKALAAAIVADLTELGRARPLRDDVKQALAVLREWIGQARAPADPRPAGAGNAIARLPARFDAVLAESAAKAGFKQQVDAALRAQRWGATHLILQSALADLTPGLTGRALPKPLLDNLEKLQLLGALAGGDTSWRAPFEKGVQQLRDMIGHLDLPPEVVHDFEANSERVLASAGPIEAGSRLALALGDLRKATARRKLSPELRDLLDHLEQAGRPKR